MSRRGQRGSSVLYVVVLSPVILLTLAFALEAGALQMEKERLSSAAEMAAVTAGSAGATVTDGISLDGRASETTLRAALVDNLMPLSDVIVGMSPLEIAAGADVYAITAVPATDPLDPSRTLDRPTIETRLSVPVQSGLLSMAGLPRTVTLTITSSADLRVIGGDQP